MCRVKGFGARGLFKFQVKGSVLDLLLPWTVRKRFVPLPHEQEQEIFSCRSRRAIRGRYLAGTPPTLHSTLFGWVHEFRA